MPRFFFDEINGVLGRDTEGVDLPTPTTARVEAIKLLGAMLAERPALLAGERHFRLQVTDAAGVVLFTVTAFATAPGPVGGRCPAGPSGEAGCERVDQDLRRSVPALAASGGT